MIDAMTLAEAGALADRAWKLPGAREITPHQFALFDAPLWSCRRHGTSTTRTPYSQLQRLAGVAVVGSWGPHLFDLSHDVSFGRARPHGRRGWTSGRNLRVAQLR